MNLYGEYANVAAMQSMLEKNNISCEVDKLSVNDTLQLMDYYFVLRQGFTEEERSTTMHTLHSLGMKRFTAAVMWVLQEVFGLEDKYLLTPPNESEGRFLLNEIMRSGNFGQYDQSLRRTRNDSDLSYALRKLQRIFRFIRSYPSEVLWSPIFKMWHYFWRKKMQTG